MFFRLLFISSSIALLVLALFLVTDEQVRKRKINIIIISVESLRRDMVTREYTPELLKAAEQGLRFSRYRAVSGWTGTNIVSLLSGLSPFESGVHTRGQSVNPDYQMPLEQLGENGYLVQGLQPFMSVDLYKNLGLNLGDSGLDPKLWMARNKIENRPFFLWFHYLKTHLPYGGENLQALEDLPTVEKQRLEKVRKQAGVHFDEARFTRSDTEYIRQLQASSIKEFDLWFKEFWEFYRQGGFHRDSVLVITSDHGDEHGERGMVGHASTTLAGHLHEEIVQIPLFIWLPMGSRKFNVDTEIVCSHIDLMPTLLPLVGITPSSHLTGRDLFSAQKTGTWYGMSSSGGFNEPDPQNIRYFSYSYLEQTWKAHLKIDKNLNETSALYNLATDPLEIDNLAESHPLLCQRLEKELKKKIATQAHRPIAGKLERTLPGTAPGNSPAWLFPEQSGTYTFDQLQGEIVFRWTGQANSGYIIEYKAGIGSKQISGTLEVEGNKKNFGKIDRFYWDTWIAPQKRFQLRVRKADQAGWSPWLTLEVRP